MIFILLKIGILLFLNIIFIKVGRGDHPIFFGNVIFEITVDKKAPSIGATFGGVLGPVHLSGRGLRPYPYRGVGRCDFYFWSKTMQIGAYLKDLGLLSIRI